MTVVIAGCGDLGIEAGRRFHAAGHRVLGLRRSGHLVPSPLEGVSIDLRVEQPEIPADTEVVVVALAAGERTAKAYRATYVDGLGHVLDAVEASGASPRILLVSSTAVYDVEDGSWVDETTPATAATPTGAVLVEAEGLLRRRAPGAVALRLGGIYGPGRERLISQVRGGLAGIPAGSLWTNRIHRDDAAAAIVHLATAVEDPREVYLGVDDEPAQFGEVVRFLAGELGVAPPADNVPASRQGGGDKRVSNARLRATGFEFAYPTYREGYRALLSHDDARDD